MKPYTYLIGWSQLDMFYYGRRTSKKCTPDDLWKTYFTSSKIVKEYRKNYGEPDIIQIRKVFESPELCAKWESKVLRRIDAQHHVKMLNKKNGDEKWDTSGLVYVKEQNSLEHFMVNVNDPRYISGELVYALKGRKQSSKNKNTVTVKDKHGNFSRVSKDDVRYINGELVGVNLGLIPVKDKMGNGFLVDKNDSRYISGELVHVSKGVSNIKCKGMVTVRGLDGKCFNVSVSDPRYISGELVAASKGKKRSMAKRGKNKIVECPHCGKDGGINAMKRWHFDNCKLIKI